MTIEELEAVNRVLVDRLIDCKASNRSLSQKCKALVKSKCVMLVPRVCAFCEHYKEKGVETYGHGYSMSHPVLYCEQIRPDWIGREYVAPLHSCQKFQMKKLEMKEATK